MLLIIKGTLVVVKNAGEKDLAAIINLGMAAQLRVLLITKLVILKNIERII